MTGWPATYRFALVLLLVTRSRASALIVEILQSDFGVVRHSAPVTTSTIGIVKAGAIVADLDRLVADLRSKSVDIAFGPYAAHNGQRANVIVRDLDGNLIQFFGR